MTNTDIQAVILENLDSLRRFAYSLTNDMHDADDLVQVVVERLLAKSIPEAAKPLPWMFTVCKNAWIDEIRSRQVRATDDEIEPDQLAASEQHNSLEQAAQKQDLHEAIESLPDAYRIVIRLIIISGLSYAETAETLDIPIGTVMSRVARAREKLATVLAGRAEEYA